MNQEQSIALWRQGKDAWNAWAEGMVAEHKALQDGGLWQVEEIGSMIECQNDDTFAWIQAATVDFSYLHFITRALADKTEPQDEQNKETLTPSRSVVTTQIVEGYEIDFGGLIFPWQAQFAGSQFYGGWAKFGAVQFHGVAGFAAARFHNVAWFPNTQFHGEAWFRDARFHGRAGFEGAHYQGKADFDLAQFDDEARLDNMQFHGEARFRRAQFHGEARFRHAQFYGEAGFGDAQFHGEARFHGAQFHGQAGFGGAQFHGQARFRDAKFYGRAGFEAAQFHGEAGFEGAPFHGQAGFANAMFKASTSFMKAIFGTKTKRQDADFTGIKVERAFDMTGARFSKVPAFNQASFVEAPDLDDVAYPFPPFFRFWIRGWEDAEKTTRKVEKFKADAAKYRHLRRLAILGHDHENEGKAFKGETRAKRGTEHKPWLAAFWFGVGYDALSDFGRSMMRPLYAWAVLTALFAVFYLGTAGIDAPVPAADAGWFGRTLPFTKAALVGDLKCKGGTGQKAEKDATDKALENISPTGEAVYLAIKNGLIVVGLGSEGKINQAHACLYGGTLSTPLFPSGISVWQIAQNFLSAPLIFLFLLGVRNQFKIK